MPLNLFICIVGYSGVFGVQGMVFTYLLFIMCESSPPHHIFCDVGGVCSAYRI